jgi:hypothetical protein
MNAGSHPRLPVTESVVLPRKIGVWTRSDKPRQIVANTIFAYMGGAGELYLGYRLRWLDVYDYVSSDQDAILAELYWMESSDDAFGLLSDDWGGEPVAFGKAAQNEPMPSNACYPHALYGAGLLRLWSGNLYARITAHRETEDSKKAVWDLGRAVSAGREDPDLPALLRLLPSTFDSKFRLRMDRLCYFHSHLVLNAVYFLSSTNLLDLSNQTEAATAIYESEAEAGKRQAFRALLIRYPDALAAQLALEHFCDVYLPEQVKARSGKARLEQEICRIEDGWLGYHLRGSLLLLAFECPSGEMARLFLGHLGKAEDLYE